MLAIIQKVDDTVWDWLQDHQHFALDYFCRDVTSLGGSSVIILGILLSSALLGLNGHVHQAWMQMVGYAIATFVVCLSKEFFSRKGPLPYDPWHTGLLPKLKIHHFPAFPSGHTAMSVYYYTSQALLLAHFFPSVQLLVPLALVFALVIGVGKMYLGAHWLSDIIGGYALGLLFLWLLKCFTSCGF